MIRDDEEVILFPALARPIGDGRWAAAIRGVIFRPCTDSLRRRLLIQAIARAAGVNRSPVALQRLRRSLTPFLVDNRSRRRVRVQVADQCVVLGPSGRNGHLAGEAVFTCGDRLGVTVESSTTPGEHKSRRFTGTVHLLPASGVSVISDIDDTIKHSCVPDTRELLRNTFLRPFRCVASVRAMHQGLAHSGAAFHYVSASPWQLFPALHVFTRRAGLPDGSFHLKAFRVKDRSALALLAPPDAFKIAAIEPMLHAWPRRRFILVGDSAERDPEIYGELSRRRPQQVATIVIRDMTGDARDSARYQAAMAGVPRDRWHILDDDADWIGLAAEVAADASAGVR